MPLYEYECRACEARFERLTTFADADAGACPRCGAGEARRLLSVIGGVTGSSTGPGATSGPVCGQGACAHCS